MDALTILGLLVAGAAGVAVGWQLRGSSYGPVTKCDLQEMMSEIMSAIGDWSVKVGPKLDRIQTGLDVVQKLVEDLQNSPGTISPEDQALLDQIEAKVDAIATDADSVPTPPPV